MLEISLDDIWSSERFVEKLLDLWPLRARLVWAGENVPHRVTNKIVVAAN